MQKPTISDCVKALTPNELPLDVLARRLNSTPAVLLPILQTGGGMGYVRCGKSNGQVFWSVGEAPPPADVPLIASRVILRRKKRPHRSRAQIDAAERAAEEARAKKAAEPKVREPSFNDKLLARAADQMASKPVEPEPGSVFAKVTAMTEPTADAPRVDVELWTPPRGAGTVAARRALHRLRNKLYIFRPYMPPQPELSAELQGEEVWLQSMGKNSDAHNDQRIVLRITDIPVLIQALAQLKAVADA